MPKIPSSTPSPNPAPDPGRDVPVAASLRSVDPSTHPDFYTPPSQDSHLASDEFLKAADAAFTARAAQPKSPSPTPSPSPQARPAVAPSPPPAPSPTSSPSPEEAPSEEAPSEAPPSEGSPPAPSAKPTLEDPFVKTPPAIKGKAADNWRTLKADRDRWKKQAEDYETRLKTAGQAPPADLEAVAQERDRYKEIVSRALVEHDPSFQAKYKPLFDAASTLALSSVPADRRDTVQALLASPPSEARDARLEELLDGLSDLKRTRLISGINEHDRVTALRDTELGQARANWAQIQRDHALEGQRALQAQSETLERRLTELSREGAPFHADAADAEKSAKLEAIKVEARRVLSGNLSPKELANAAILAAMGPTLIVDLEAANDRVAELEAEIESMKAIAPSPGGGTAEPPSPLPADDTSLDGLSYGEQIARLAARQGLFGARGR